MADRESTRAGENVRANDMSSAGMEKRVPSDTPPKGIDIDRLLGGIKLDEEKIIIIMLIIILARNGADMPLLIALGYLLM